MQPEPDRQAVIAWVLIAAGIGAFCANLYANRFFYHDDAFISLRYAGNLLAAGDLSWNPGERIEGYTNFLHLLIVAALMALGVPGIAATQVVNALAVAALLAATIAGSRRLAPDQTLARAAGLAVVLAANSLAIWLLGGLEAVLAAALLAWALVALLPLFGPQPPPGHRGAVAAALLFALAYLTRPDSLITCLVAGCAVLAFGRAAWRQRGLDFLIIGTIPAAVLAAHLAWRYGYYGELLPNTYHAKVGVPLAARLARVPHYALAATVVYMPAISFAFIAFAALVVRGRLSRPVAFLMVCLVAHGSYVAWSGGDHMPAARVLLQQLVPAALVFTVGLATLGPAPRQVLAIAAVILAGAATWSAGIRKEDEAAYIGRTVGQHIATAWPDGAVVALHTAGSTPFYAPDKVYIDMLGLNDRHIGKREAVPIVAPYQLNAGHTKGDGAYVLSRAPDYIIAGPAEGGPVEDPWFLSDVELAASAGFRRCYALRRERLPYRVAAAAVRPEIANPLTFTYYARTC